MGNLSKNIELAQEHKKREMEIRDITIQLAELTQKSEE